MRIDLVDHQRRQTEGRLVEQHQLRPHHQRAADRQHLLLAARHGAGLLVRALAQPREIAVDALDIGGDAGAVAARHGAELQVLLDRHAAEGAAPFRHMGDAEPRALLRRFSGERLAGEDDLAGGLDHAGQRAQRRGLAGAVGAEKGGDVALDDVEVDPVQDLRRAVEGAELSGGEQGPAHRLMSPDRPG